MRNDITIGMDLGNRKHKVFGIDRNGDQVIKAEVANTADALRPFFTENKGATVAMETGLCCRWISALARECGCDPVVGNARKLRAVWSSDQKNDWNDAKWIAKIARSDRELFHPVSLRDDEHHALIQILRLREIAVRQRTQIANAIRGTCKAGGSFLPSFGAESFHNHRDDIPEPERWKFEPFLERLDALAEGVRRYDWMIRDYADAHFREQVELLMTVPGVGLITSCAFVAHVADPKRFGKPRDAGCYFGLTPGQDQSGDVDNPQQITKAGSTFMRKLLINSANYILRDGSADTALKRYGQRICARGGKIARRKAKTAIARKLAVIMMAMLQSGKPYDGEKAAYFKDARQSANDSAAGIKCRE